MQAIRYQSYKITDNHATKMEDALVIEAPLQININKEAYTVVMRTPADDKELIRGLLFAEDIYKQKEALVSLAKIYPVLCRRETWEAVQLMLSYMHLCVLVVWSISRSSAIVRKHPFRTIGAPRAQAGIQPRKNARK